MDKPAGREDPFSSARFGKGFLLASLEHIVSGKVTHLSCAPLRGDASDRRYFRVGFRKPDGETESVVVMQLMEPSNETETDFTRMLKFLRGLRLPVPELLHHDAANGILFLQDCGDTTLEDRVRHHPQETRVYYEMAVDLLARLQTRATRHIGPDCPAYHLRFDVPKLMWEFDFMLEHYVGGLNKTALKEKEAGEIRSRFLPLCETLAAQEPCFTHRDYHSRNLMAHDGELVIIDFQDARMGPSQYDLASLLKDSYMQLDETLREELLQRFVRRREEEEGRAVDYQAFCSVFDLMSIQRNLKAVGTFAFQSVAKANDRYLDYIPPTLNYVRQTLSRRPDLAPLEEVLIKYIPGLQSGTTGDNR